MNVAVAMAATVTMTMTAVEGVILVVCERRSKWWSPKARSQESRGIWDRKDAHWHLGWHIEEFDGKLITRKKKEVIATTRLNVYVSQELNRAEQYTEKEIGNKIDTIMKKGKSMYVNYQKRGRQARSTAKEMQILTRKWQRLPGQTLRHSLSDSKNLQHWALDQCRTQQ